MFRHSVSTARHYTHPIVISKRYEDGTTSSNIATFIILNQDGWVLTSCHILNDLNDLKKAVSDADDSLTHYSVWWGKDDWIVDKLMGEDISDLALGKIKGFDKNSVKKYPGFKNPNIQFSPGEMLCKIGYPLMDITPTYDEKINKFGFVFDIPQFPIEGIFTREATRINGKHSAKFIETSSPGLLGQSGGPTLDSRGRIWAIQSCTIHYHLGFDPVVPNQEQRKEDQFLNAGLGTHATTIISFLRKHDVKIKVSKD